MTQSIGPPSLAQGTRIAVGFSTSISRFIPAYAGNSRTRSPENWRRAVHPRLRGELGIAQALGIDDNGSSPLTRGTPSRALTHTALIRFIPAYAGNSMPSVARRKILSVHPRLRGELNVSEVFFLFVSGSSPLTRGTHLNKA